MQTQGSLTPIRLIDMQLPEVLAMPALLLMTPAQLKKHIEVVHQQGDLAQLCMQMYYVFLLANQYDAALEMQTRALQLGRIYRIAGTQNPQLRLLVVMGPGHMQHNTPIEFVLHGSEIQTDILYLLPDDEVPAVLPTHDVTFVAIGESTKNTALLGKLNAMLNAWPTTVINQPHAIPNCARDTCYQLLKNIPDVILPLTKRVRKEEDVGMNFPFTLRPIDTQGGEGLQRIAQAEELTNYYATFPVDEYYAAKFLDYQSQDGCYRKLRIVLIDGKPYICHMAISQDWMVHYLSAGMDASPEKRFEEQHTMEHFEQDFAIRFKDPLAAMAKALQLDYVTMDCAESRDGKLIVFEVDSRGLIHAADSKEIYPYKLAVMQKAFHAFYALLFNRAGQSSQTALSKVKK